MMKTFHNLSILVFIYFILNVNGRRINVVSVDERSICNIKRLCQDCLRLPQCSWCSEEEKCFSKELLDDEKYCENGITRQTNFSLSLEDNAECACAGDKIMKQCHRPGDSEGLECSGRGSCHCGRCFCDVPDAENPSKVIIGEYCEFDNFSCDGSKCNEGPYSIYDVQKGYKSINDEGSVIENPEELQLL